MANIGNDITKIAEQTGRPANVITAGLKNIGNGKMENGIKVIVEHAERVGYTKGIRQGYSQGSKNGAIKGSAITALILSSLGGISYLYQRNKYKKEMKELDDINTKEKSQIIEVFKNTDSSLSDISQESDSL